MVGGSTAKSGFAGVEPEGTRITRSAVGSGHSMAVYRTQPPPPRCPADQRKCSDQEGSAKKLQPVFRSLELPAHTAHFLYPATNSVRGVFDGAGVGGDVYVDGARVMLQ
jgi:hypothetical protein